MNRIVRCSISSNTLMELQEALVLSQPKKRNGEIQKPLIYGKFIMLAIELPSTFPLTLIRAVISRVKRTDVVFRGAFASRSEWISNDAESVRLANGCGRYGRDRVVIYMTRGANTAVERVAVVRFGLIFCGGPLIVRKVAFTGYFTFT